MTTHEKAQEHKPESAPQRVRPDLSTREARDAYCAEMFNTPTPPGQTCGWGSSGFKLSDHPAPRPMGCLTTPQHEAYRRGDISALPDRCFFGHAARSGPVPVPLPKRGS